tara:strand:+ start:206 stop:385 length:180 start_codon:yes stop_codon:yes gene_type:complete
MAKKAIKYSLTFVLIPTQLPNKQRGTNKVVNKIKNKEIPSIPRIKLIFIDFNHSNRSTN